MEWRKSRKLSSTISICAAATVALGACGGSGNKPSANNPGTGAPAAGTITSANAVDVVGEASEAMMHTHMLAGVSSGLASCGTTGTCSGSTRIMAFEGVQDALNQLVNTSQDPAAQLAVMQAPIRALVNLPVSNCAEGGTISGQLNDVNNDNVPNSGDTLTYTFNACTQRGGTRQGTVTISNFNLNGMPNVPGSPWSFSGTVDLQNYSSTRNNRTTTTNGSLVVNWSSNGTMMDQGTVNISQLTMAHSGRTMTFSNVTMNMSMDNTLQETSMVMSGQLNVSTIGQMTIETPIAMKAKMGQMVPFSGSLTVRLSGSNVSVNTTTSPNVELRIDGDNNGTVDDVVTSTWEQIHGMGNMPMPGQGGNTGTIPGRV